MAGGEPTGTNRAKDREQLTPPDVPDAQARRTGEHERLDVVGATEREPEHDHASE